MFIGQYVHGLDEKNRLIIPAKFRDNLGSSAIITKGFDGSLAIYTAEEWSKLLSQLASLNSNTSDARRHVRVVSSSATECEWDRQGRVILPANLIQLAGIKKEVVLVGVLNRIEIWSKETWEAYYDESSTSFDQIAEGLPKE